MVKKMKTIGVSSFPMDFHQISINASIAWKMFYLKNVPTSHQPCTHFETSNETKLVTKGFQKVKKNTVLSKLSIFGPTVDATEFLGNT
jgi:hypothetical protein